MKEQQLISLKAMIFGHRLEEMTAIFKFIESSDTEECARIIEEIRCVHDNLMAFNPDTGLFAKIESVCLNGEDIQLNIEKEVKDGPD